MLIRKDSKLHQILLTVKARGTIGPSEASRRALAQLVDLGLVTAGSPNGLTAAGKRAVRRIKEEGSYGTGVAPRS